MEVTRVDELGEQTVTAAGETSALTDLVIITGFSRAGKSTAMAVFEDEGYFCVDNLPSEMIRSLVELFMHAGSKVQRDGHRPVAPARAPDGDHQVRLALGQVLGQQVVQQWLDVVIEDVERSVAVDVGDDARIGAGEGPQVGLVVGVWQEADVEQEIGVAAGPVLEAEALEGDGEPARGL